jgi:DNA invertase Pin-like site-specific DNA recombinase
MRVCGYIFLAQDKEYLVPAAEQEKELFEYARSIDLPITDIFTEEQASLQQPFHERPQGGALLRQLISGDALITMKAAWILNSAIDGDRLLRLLHKDRVALHCVDLGANISMPEKRRLVVSEGPAELVRKLLAALSISEGSRHGQAIRIAKKHRKQQGKYLGGPVPFGWEVNDEGYLVPNEGQQKIIEEIATMRMERWSYREISGKLLDEFDIRLSHEGVRKILAGNTRRRLPPVKGRAKR